MRITPATAADRVQRRVVAMVAGVALAVLMVQYSAARRAEERAGR
jgi:hypothetical protein